MSKSYVDMIIDDDDRVAVADGGAVRIDDRHAIIASISTHERLARAHLEAARRLREKARLPLFEGEAREA